MKKCLILGGAGFLGINLLNELLSRGYDVTIYNRRSSHVGRVKRLFPHVKIILGDFSKEIDFSSLLNGVDVVFHLISTTKPSNRDVMEEFEGNLLPTIRLLDSCRTGNIRIIYFSSGGTVYGIPRQLPLNEGHRTDPISAYGIQKLSIEKCLEYYGRTYGLDYIILRISNPYGSYQDTRVGQGAIAVFLARALLGQKIEVWGDGSVIRDYIFVQDVINACMKMISYKGNERIFNVGSGQGYSLQEILYLIQGFIGHAISVQYLPRRIQDVPANILDNSLLRGETGWEVHTSLEDGLSYMLESWDANSNEYCFLSGDRT